MIYSWYLMDDDRSIRELMYVCVSAQPTMKLPYFDLMLYMYYYDMSLCVWVYSKFSNNQKFNNRK